MGLRVRGEGLDSSPANVLSGLRLGPLANMGDLPGITDIAVDPDGSVWADTGNGMRRRHPLIPLIGDSAVRRLAVFLCAQLGVPLDDAHPVADASTPAGLRLNALLPPLVPHGASISLRVPSASTFSLEDLECTGFFAAPELAGLLRGLVAHRATLLITGGTGAGKTTLLRALLRQSDPHDRLVIIEEVRELGTVDHPDVVSLASRRANGEGKGAIGLDALVEASLRMRPDRIVLGECRGGEAADVLRAFNTGHTGGMLTLHADGVSRVPSRLAALAHQGGMSERQAAVLLSGSFDAVLHSMQCCIVKGGKASAISHRLESLKRLPRGRSDVRLPSAIRRRGLIHCLAGMSLSATGVVQENRMACAAPCPLMKPLVMKTHGRFLKYLLSRHALAIARPLFHKFLPLLMPVVPRLCLFNPVMGHSDARRPDNHG